MTNINIVKTFNNKDFNIVKEGGMVWFRAKDVAEALGYKQPDKAVRDHVKDDEKRIGQKGGNERLLSNAKYYQINESGLYRLVFSSKLKTAEVFRKWVFNEVLPCIRESGAFRQVKVSHGVVYNQLSIKSEADLHYEVVKEIRKRFPQLVLVVCGGELQDTKEKRIDMWKKGFVGGQPDIMITNPHKKYNGLHV